MDEDKIISDIPDKRKVEDDNSTKPNPKRIKLVRPVFSPIAKPTISTVELKSEVQSTEETLKSAETVFNLVNVPQSPEISIDELETINKPKQETVKNFLATTLVSEEQVDDRSDALDIQNIFSEETKKELEDLKKNIFKVEDDGSSSENDSQPKRPRLKRPTFVTSSVDVKVESNSSTNISDKIKVTSKLDLFKSVCEENINSMNKTFEKQLPLGENIGKVIESTPDISLVNEVEHSNIITENKCEKKANEIDNDMKLLEEKLIVTESINRVVELKSTTSQSFDKIVEEKNSVDENLCGIIKIQTDNDVQEKIVENKPFLKVDSTIKTPSHIKKEMTEEKQNLLDKINEIGIEVYAREILKDNVRIVLERCDGKSNDKALNKESVSSLKLEDESDNIIKTKNKDLIDAASITLNINNKETKSETEFKCSKHNDKKDIIKGTQVTKTIVTTEGDTLENEKTKSNSNVQVKNECCFNMLPNKVPSTDINQEQDEQESHLFKSDILKAALMSKKSPESIATSSEELDQLDANVNSTLLDIQKSEMLPTIGQEAIVNKIEDEINFSINDQPTNKEPSEILNSVPGITISNEKFCSISVNENITVGKHDEPPKWGSAKMNEVEKFLNDSNVTITPINKSQESPKLGKITLKLPKVGNPEIKSETTVRPDVKSELIKKITNKQNAMGDSPLKNALSQPSKSFSDFATIRPTPKPSAEQIAQLEQQIKNTPKRRGRPSKALAQQKQLLLQYQQQQQLKVQEGSVEDEAVFHVPLFDMEDMSGGGGMFDSFDASTPKRGKGIRGKGSRGRRGRGGRGRGRDESDSDTMSNSRRMEDEGETYPEEVNQEEETKQVAIIEAERLRKEEEREKKMAERKRKLKIRNDALKEKKMRKKQKAEERRLQWHVKKKLMQEEKAKAAEMKKTLPPPQNFDDETRMSADCNNSLSQTPARNFIMGEDDLSISTTNDSIRMKKGRMEVIDLESNKTLTVDQIAEYQWPLDGGELYMIQEQISNFLGVKSFKRKYPLLKRRNVEAEERTFLCDSGLVAESLCDLGLTVLYSSEVLDIMYTDFLEKYEELREYMRLKHAKELSNRQRALMTISSNTDGSKLDLRDRAMEVVANWNATLNKSRLESRKCSMDMQTFIVHYPKNKCKKMAIHKPKIGSYPLALLPGQFCDYYATYSSGDLHYLPMNTVMYGPLKSVDKDFPVSLSSQSESEDSSSDDSSDSDDSIEVDNKLEKKELEQGPSDKKGAECKICFGTANRNNKGTVEPLIHCFKCLTIYHPTCLDMTLEMIPYIKRYNWQCNDCKSCAQCKEVADEDKMLFCDLCDRGYHIYCVGLRRVPEGRWHCLECAMCSSCGVSDPGPGDSKWFYEFKKIEKTASKVYCRTLCAPCSRLWKKGHYCPNCMRCYPLKNVERMTQCNSCDKYLHPECISENASNSQVVACNVCEEKAASRLLTTVPRSLIKV